MSFEEELIKEYNERPEVAKLVNTVGQVKCGIISWQNPMGEYKAHCTLKKALSDYFDNIKLSKQELGWQLRALADDLEDRVKILVCDGEHYAVVEREDDDWLISRTGGLFDFHVHMVWQHLPEPPTRREADVNPSEGDIRYHHDGCTCEQCKELSGGSGSET